MSILSPSERILLLWVSIRIQVGGHFTEKVESLSGDKLPFHCHHLLLSLGKGLDAFLLTPADLFCPEAAVFVRGEIGDKVVLLKNIGDFFSPDAAFFRRGKLFKLLARDEIASPEADVYPGKDIQQVRLPASVFAGDDD